MAEAEFTAPRLTQTEKDIHKVFWEEIKALKDEVERLASRLVHLPTSIVDQPEKEWYTTTEVAKRWGRKKETVRDHCRTGRIRAVRADSGRGLSKEYRIHQEEVLRLLNEGLRPPPASS